MLIYPVTPTDHCRRLDSYLQRLMPAATPSYLRKLIKSGACRLNDTAAPSDTLLRTGDQINLKESGAVLEQLKARRSRIDLLWHDDQLLVLNKPAGLAMHPAAEVDDNLVDQVSDWLTRRSNHQARAYPVNRLDRGTSGVVLLATSSSNAGILGRQIKEEGLKKRYLTVVEGRVTGEGEINQPLDEKESTSRYCSLSVGAEHSLLLVEPVTGRTHQIRRHLSMTGHPVVGDKRYNARDHDTLPGIALHSFRTSLHHPSSDRTLTISAPVPAALQELITACCGLDEAAVMDLLIELATQV